MKIQELFYKDITRDIKGVIKIGQDDDINIQQELEEYVVTRELKTHIDKFFSNYKKGMGVHNDKMGVWISGFFGSGKSHFLKILSYLLENREVNGKRAIDYFNDKEELQDQMLLADIARAGRMDTDVILFNIDSKADADSKSNKEAIVKVFNKVFYEHLGYCGSIPWLAALERKMDRDGIYLDFQNIFAEIADEDWKSARNDFYFIEDEFAESYAAVTGKSKDDALRWYYKAGDNYSLSVDQFAKTVNEYIESQEANHRVVFLVDEIGQYIGDDHNLMLNLQTVAEDLGTYCGGRAWVIVTSQQDIDSVIKVKGNEFSKIQGRFDTRLNMSSANVDEVIKKRLLRKNQTALETLVINYQDHASIIQNLLTFSHGTPEKKYYHSAEEYAEVYPFIPYQFQLLQDVFSSIRTHGASGKHLAEGERSLLSAFQESAVKNKDRDLDFLMPFYAFYGSIESFLDHDINIVIQRAIDNENLNEFDVNVLKLMFLIKYLTDKVPPNIENITTLMVDGISTDKLDLEKRVRDSLDKLFVEAYIQKNGDEYVFLTNAEQDINSEIKNINVDYADVIKNLSAIAFDKVLKANNRYEYNKEQIFTYNHKFDEDYYSSQKGELNLHLVTPMFRGKDAMEQELKMISMQDSSVIFQLPESTYYFEEIEEAMRIDTYIRRNTTKINAAEAQGIKMAKIEEGKARRERAADQLANAMSKANVYAFGQQLTIGERSAQVRVTDAFRALVENKYSKIHDMKSFIPSNGVKTAYLQLLREKIRPGMVSSIPNEIAYLEIEKYVEDMTKLHAPITVKSIVEKYAKEPYHWRSEDVRGLLLHMLKRKAINMVYAGQKLSLENVEDVVNTITKVSNFGQIKVEKRIKPTKELLSSVSSILDEAFNPGFIPTEEGQLKDLAVKLLKRELNEHTEGGQARNIEGYLRQYEASAEYPYPGKQILLQGKETIEAILKEKDDIAFFKAIQNAEDDLLDYMEDSVDVKEFFKNKKKHFDEALEQIHNYKESETYVTDQKAMDMIKRMTEIVSMPAPYAKIVELPNLRTQFALIFAELLDQERDIVQSVVEGEREATLEHLNEEYLSDQEKAKLLEEIQTQFDQLIHQLDYSKLFKDVVFKKDEANRKKVIFIKQIDELVRSREEAEAKQKGQAVSEEPKKKVVRVNLTNYARGFKDIETEDDLDEVMKKFRELVKKEMQKNTVVKFY